jgi:arylsulfatase A-like enzyme
MIKRPPLAAIFSVFVLATFAASVRAAAAAAHSPNILYVLCDDLGYGDVHALNPTRGKIPTPNFDRLASEGMCFTDAHSGSSVCTPTRYGILTGRYSWRSKLQQGVLQTMSPPLIAKDRLTVAALLKQHGYTTAALGKWHVGLEYGKVNFTDPITDGPLQHGFDSFFGIAASLDMPPYFYITNDRVSGKPTEQRQWFRPGLAAKGFEASDVLPALTKHALDFIKAQKAERPFFLYLAYASPHTPLVPKAEWKGKSGLGEYADFVMQTDDAVGQVISALDESGLAKDTLVIFTSDNGFAPYVGAKQLEDQGHFPSAEFRGYKSDVWEGGHRIPFIARWPGMTKAGARNDALVCLTDLIATCAELVGETLQPNAGEDSVSMLPLLKGQPGAAQRESVINHSAQGQFAIRTRRWKLEMCAGSGGWSTPHEVDAAAQGLPAVQLYDMKNDVGEQHNVESANPEVVRELQALLQKQVAAGRSTPGPDQKNDVAIKIVKPAGKPAAKKKQPD